MPGDIVVIENEEKDLRELRAEFKKVGVDGHVKSFSTYLEAERDLLGSATFPAAIVSDLDMGGKPYQYDGSRILNAVFDKAVAKTGFGVWTLLLSSYDRDTLDRIETSGRFVPHETFRKPDGGAKQCARLLANAFKPCPEKTVGLAPLRNIAAKDRLFIYSNKNAQFSQLFKFCSLLAIPGRPEPPSDKVMVMYRGHCVAVGDHRTSKLVQYLLRWRILAQAGELDYQKLQTSSERAMGTGSQKLTLEGGIEGAIDAFRLNPELRRLTQAVFNGSDPLPKVYRQSEGKPLPQPLIPTDAGGTDLLSIAHFALDQDDLTSFSRWQAERAPSTG
jgi:hypothetical protein